MRKLIFLILIGLLGCLTKQPIDLSSDLKTYEEVMENPLAEKYEINGMIYLLMIDRFNNGDKANDYNHRDDWYTNMQDPMYGYQGGDLKGIAETLPYLKELGVEALHLTPWLSNPDEKMVSFTKGGKIGYRGEYSAHHGYHVNNHFKIDEHFISSDYTWDQFIKDLKKYDMKLIHDISPNHTSTVTMSKDLINFEFHKNLKGDLLGGKIYGPSNYKDLMSPDFDDWSSLSLDDKNNTLVMDFYKDAQEYAFKESIKRSGKGISYGEWGTIFHLDPKTPLGRTSLFHHVGVFEIRDWVDPIQQNGNIFQLADLNWGNKEVANYLMNSYGYWFSQGVSGLRLDAAKHIATKADIRNPKSPDNYLKLLADRMKEITGYDRLLMLSEWYGGNDDEKYYYLEGDVDMSLYIFESNKIPRYLKYNKLDRITKFYKELNLIPDPTQLGMFIDNHDMPRVPFTETVTLDTLTIMLLSVGVLELWQGTEFRFMPGASGDEGRDYIGLDQMLKNKNNPIFKRISDLNKLKREFPNELKYSKMTNIGNTDELFYFVRTIKDKSCIVVVNTSDYHIIDKLEIKSILKGDYFEVSTKEQARISWNTLSVDLDAHSYKVFIKK